MSDTWRENAIVQAIELIVNKRISQASYDTTIKAFIEQIKDQTINEYIVKYQDSRLTAYGSGDTHYAIGDEVLIHVPGNDLTKTKTIMGSTTHLASTYKQVPQVSSLYNKIGTNAITIKEDGGSFGELNSYQTALYYVFKKGDKQNSSININQQAIQKYVKRGNGLAIGMYVQTSLDDSQVGGKYGVIFNLEFNDAQGNAAVRPYIVSSKDVIGNPYGLRKETYVESFINDIDIDNFIGVESIQIFIQDFPQDPSKIINDVHINDICIFGASELTEQQLDGYLLHIDYSTNGDTLNSAINELKLMAQLKVKGKIVKQKVLYFWFKQNGRVFRNSTYGHYCSYGGDGWECLNAYIDEGAKTGYIGLQTPEFYIVQAGSQRLNSGAAAVLTQKVNKIKCVAVYDNIPNIYGECIIYNDNILDNIIIRSSDILQSGENKTTYYLNNGKPSLTCQVRDKDNKVLDSSNYTYLWTVASTLGRAVEVKIDSIKKNETTSISSELLEQNYKSYSEKLQTYEGFYDKQAKDNYYNVTLAPSKELYNFYFTEQFIYKNTYHNFPISSIINYSIIRCAVTDKQNRYIGSASITLYNKPQMEGMYSLNIINGVQVFQYDEKGNSPASQQLKNPITISPLTFNLIDNTGKEIPYKQIEHEGKVRWIIPNIQTLLSYTGNESGVSGEEDLIVTRADLPLPASNYTVYTNIESFPYTIAQQYDSKKNINHIWLNVEYKDLSLDTYTNFTFPKNGDPGTNGTDYVAKISVNDGADTIYVVNGTNPIHFDNQGTEVEKLDFLLYNNSRQVNDISVFTEGKIKPNIQSYVKYENDTLKADFQDSEISDNYIETVWQKFINDKPVNIIRQYCKVGDIKYYAEQPVCSNIIKDFENNILPKYRIKLKPKTGFKYVVYAQDGTSPDYDNTVPFELIVEEVIGGFYSPVDTSLKYEWITVNDFLILPQKEEDRKQKQIVVTPSPTFNGEDLSTALMCKVSKNSQVIGFIHIPIYMCLNRYGHAALNKWDGNSIQLDANNNSMILAPQVGAGKKNDESNTFTGIVIGTQKNLTSDPPEETGLLGYDKGVRSIFLDAETGNAIFGKPGAGQIKIDASSGQGTIESGDYNYNTTKGDDGNPIGTGMKIKFSSGGDGPYIKYGSGNFQVDKNGHITAQGGGKIAGWNIDDNKFYKDTASTSTGMASGNWTVNDIKNTLPNTTDTVAFYAGEGIDKSKSFYVTHKGYLYSKDGHIGGWTISDKDLTNSNVGMNGDPNNSNYTVSNHSSKAFFANGNKFYVTHDGYLRSTSGKIADWEVGTNTLTNGSVGLGESPTKITSFGGNIASTEVKIWGKNNQNVYNFVLTNSGKLYSRQAEIGGWTVTNDKIYTGSSSSNSNGIRLESDGSITGGTNGTSNSWQVSKNGSATFNNITANGGSLAGWNFKDTGDGTINTETGEPNNTKFIGDGSTVEGSKVALYVQDGLGHIKANRGTIGSCDITDSQIKGTSGNWYISDSAAHFAGLVINGNGVTSSAGGTQGVSGLYANPGNVQIPYGNNDLTLDKYIEKLSVKALDVDTSFTFQNVAVKWQTTTVVTRVISNIIKDQKLYTGLTFIKDSEGKVTGGRLNYITTNIVTDVDVYTKSFHILTNAPSDNAVIKPSEQHIPPGAEDK